MFRPAYSSDYFKTTENVKDIPTANASNQGDVIPLRWIPWEVYIMVRLNITKILKNRNTYETFLFFVIKLNNLYFHVLAFVVYKK